MSDVATDLNAFGCSLWQIGELPEARDQFRRLLEYADLRKDSWLRSVALNNLAAISRELGGAPEAAALQQRSWDAAHHESLADERDAGLGCDLGNRANDALLAGDLSLAERLLRVSLRWEMTHGTAEGQAADWGSLGIVALLRGEARQALRCFGAALRLHRALADHRGIGSDLLHLGELCVTLGRWKSALRLLARARRHFQRAGTRDLAAKATRSLVEAQRHSVVATFDATRN